MSQEIRVHLSFLLIDVSVLGWQNHNMFVKKKSKKSQIILFFDKFCLRTPSRFKVAVLYFTEQDTIQRSEEVKKMPQIMQGMPKNFHNLDRQHKC